VDDLFTLGLEERQNLMANTNDLQTQIMQRLATVDEPELHKDLVTLNMIRDLKIEKKKATFTLVLTTPACPLKDQILSEARAAVLSVDGIQEVQIDVDASVPADRRVSGRLNLNVRNLIAVSSGKGGVGKSTVAANLAVALAQSGAKVGLMDADILGPNLPMMMGISHMPPPNGARLIPAEAYGVQIMSMGFIVDPNKPMVWRGPMIHSAIRQFFTDVDWGDLDYMVIDLPPGTGDAQLSLAQSVPLTGAIIVTQPQEVALADARRGLVMFEHVQVPIIGIVENMSGESFGQGGGQKLAAERGVPFLGSVPLDPQVRVGGDGGQPIVAASPDSPAAMAMRAVAEQVAARVSVLTLNQDDTEIEISTVG
jgi:ATP-binding protein involved in chromosome partitioning